MTLTQRFLPLALFLWLLPACKASPNAEPPPVVAQNAPSKVPEKTEKQDDFKPDEDCDAPKELVPPKLLAGETKSFGAPLVISTEPMSLPQAIQHLEENTDKNIKLTATVDKVCSARGCWMTFKDPAVPQTVRVRMKNHSFFVPKNSSGATAIAEGTLAKRFIPKELLQHYAKETEGNSEIPQQDAFEYVFVADGVQLSMPSS